MGTIPFPARGNSIPAGASRIGAGDLSTRTPNNDASSTTPIPASDEAAEGLDEDAGGLDEDAEGLDEAPAPSFSAAAAAQWTCATTLRAGDFGPVPRP